MKTGLWSTILFLHHTFASSLQTIVFVRRTQRIAVEPRNTTFLPGSFAKARPHFFETTANLPRIRWAGAQSALVGLDLTAGGGVRGEFPPRYLC